MNRNGRRSRAKSNVAVKAPAAWMMVLVIVTAGALYWNTLGHEFVFDDVTLISQNPLVSRLQFGEILKLHSYRPVRTLTYAFNYWIGGEDPFGYHLLNLLIHAANGGLLLYLLWIWSRSKTLSLTGALFFVSHPAQTAAVAYVSGRKDLLAGFFVLTGCILYTRYREKGGRKWRLIAAFFAFFLAILSKEVAIVFPVLVLLLDAVLDARRKKEGDGKPGKTLLPALWSSLKQTPLVYGGLAAAAAAALFYAVFLTEASRMHGYWGGSLATNFGTSAKLFAHYLKLAVIPYPLIADYTGRVFPLSTGLAEPATLFSILILILYFFVAFSLFARLHWVSLGMLWFFILLVPVLHLIPFHELAADHFLYLPLAGMALLFGKGMAELSRWRDDWRPAAALASVLVTIFGAMTVDRNHDWKDRQTLWEDTLQKAPDSYRANSNLGQIYSRQGKLEEGIRLTRRALELEPDQALSWSNLGVMYFEKGKDQREQENLDQAEEFQKQAIEVLGKAIQLDPADAFAYTNLGNCYKELAWIWEGRGERKKAYESRRRAVEFYLQGLAAPDSRELKQAIWFSIGGVFIDAGYHQDAVYYLKKFLQAFPRHPRGLYWMGFSLLQQGKADEAISYLETAAQLQPDLEVLGLLAKSYEKLGVEDKAIETYRRALQIAPGSTEAHYNLGVLYHSEGDDELAARHLEYALQLQPQGPLASNIREMLGLLEASGKGNDRSP